MQGKKASTINIWDNAGVDEQHGWIVEEDTHVLDLEADLLLYYISQYYYTHLKDNQVHQHREYIKNMLRLIHTKVVPEVDFVLPYANTLENSPLAYMLNDTKDRWTDGILIHLTNEAYFFFQTQAMATHIFFEFNHNSDRIHEFDQKKFEFEKMSHEELIKILLEKETNLVEK